MRSPPAATSRRSRSCDDLPDYRGQLRLVFDAFHSIERAELPVIAAVNGVAYGGGTEIVLFCDIVIASDRATFAFREARVGLQPGYGLVRGPEVIGRHWTRWLALTADMIDAQKALEIGLVQSVVPHEQLLDEALAVAGRIADNPALAVQVGKQFVNRDTAATASPRRSRRRRCSSRRRTTRKGWRPSSSGGRRASRAAERCG